MANELRYRNILKAVCEQPWALRERELAIIVDLVRFRAEGGVLDEETIQARIAAARNGPRSGAGQQNQVAVIPVYGVISQRQNLIGASSGGTSTEGLAADFRSAMADPAVGAVILEIDSPGGAVDGVPELADEIRAARGSKPITAVANTLAASAAYWIASQADEISVTPSGQVGSVGVYAVHQDMSGFYEQKGVKTTLISAGEFKTEGNEFEPLSDEAQAELQDFVDQYYAMFVAAVGKGRGISADQVRADYGKGRVMTAKRALAAGMVDRIETLDGAIARLGKQLVLSNPGASRAGYIEHVAARSFSPAIDLEAKAHSPHHTDTSDAPWDGPAEEARIPNSKGAGTFRQMYAWEDPDRDPDTKAAYKFMHHYWRGSPGPASVRACQSGIGVLNGGRGGTNIPAEDKRGVYDHLAQHQRDAGQEPAKFNGEASSDALQAELEYQIAWAAELGVDISTH